MTERELRRRLRAMMKRPEWVDPDGLPTMEQADMIARGLAEIRCSARPEIGAPEYRLHATREGEIRSSLARSLFERWLRPLVIAAAWLVRALVKLWALVVAWRLI